MLDSTTILLEPLAPNIRVRVCNLGHCGHLLCAIAFSGVLCGVILGAGDVPDIFDDVYIDFIIVK